jgi:Flp pilus assembly protein CpaB
MKSLNITFLLLAVIAGLAAAVQVARLIVKTDPPEAQQVAALTPRPATGDGVEPKNAQPQVDMADVVVTTQDLVAGAVLGDDNLRVVKFPQICIADDAICNIEEMKNKRLTHSVKRDSCLYIGDMSDDGGMKIPDHMHKYAFRCIDKNSLTLKPGDRVDVVCIEPLPNGESRSNVVLYNRLVLSEILPWHTHRDVIRSGGYSVTLCVNPEQALILSAAEKRGEVRPVLCDPESRAP